MSSYTLIFTHFRSIYFKILHTSNVIIITIKFITEKENKRIVLHHILNISLTKHCIEILSALIDSEFCYNKLNKQVKH